MSERPILMSAPMIRAILAGTKTQTRRVLPTQETMGRLEYPGRRVRGWSMVNWLDTPEGIAAAVAECRYGKPGDRLWVREAHCFCPRSPSMKKWSHSPEEARVIYGADDWWLSGPHGPHRPKMRPSIHMPRWASRITLEVTGVRVERLQDISEEDAIAEGIPSHEVSPPDMARFAYRQLWESINGPGSWAANPWVWAVEFRRIESEAAHSRRVA